MYELLIQNLRKNPFIRIIIPFIIGIIIVLNFHINLYISLSFFAITSILFVIINLINKTFGYEWIKGILINLIFISAAMFLTQSLNEKSQKDLKYYKKGTLIGLVDSEPKIMELSTKIQVKIIAYKNKDEWFETSGNTIVFIENNEAVHNLKIGDKIIFSANLQDIENKGNPEEFDFKKYLSHNLIYSTDYLNSSDWKLLKETQDFKLVHRFSRFRNRLIEVLKSNNLNNDELAVASALALGYQDSLSDQLRHAYASSGAMHILAVSGLHVGIVYGMIIFFLSFIKNEKLYHAKIIVSILLVWAYAFLTGLSPSVSRAAFMFSIMAIGNFQKHKSSSLNAVAASAFILLLINPYNLVKLGFQLSYIAVIGIIIINKPLNKIFIPKNKYIDKIWSLTTVSIAAQLVTAPLGMYYFNQFSNYFLITNYLLIPISTVAIWLIIIFFIVSPIPFLATTTAKLLVYVIKAMNFCAISIENLPYSISTGIYINFTQLIILYLIIALFFIFFFTSKEYKHLIFALVSIVFFFGIGLIKDIESSKQKYLIVYNINNNTVINVISGKKNFIIADLENNLQSNIEYSAKNNWLQKGLDNQQYIDISSNNKLNSSTDNFVNQGDFFFKNNALLFAKNSLFILNQEFRMPQNNENLKKVDVDYILLSNNPSIKLGEISKYFNFKKIIIDASNYRNNTENWHKENQILNINIHDVRIDGAFVLNL